MITYNKRVVPSFHFPAGEISVGMELMGQPYSYNVKAILKSSDDIMKLLMVADAIKREGGEIYKLEIPYLPYARQDRVCNPGEALSFKVFADLINGIGAVRVIGWDVHNPTLAGAIINNYEDISQTEILEPYRDLFKGVTVCAPDGGAMKKAFDVSQMLNAPLITANKIRNIRTGEIEKTEVNQYVPYDVLIVDDICDGGRTFIELAKVLRAKGATRVELYVTHGIFSKGLEVFDGLIDNIYTTNSYCEIVPAKISKLKIFRRDDV